VNRFRITRPSPSLLLSCVAIFAAVGGTSYAAAGATGYGSSMGQSGNMPMTGGHPGNAWASHLGGLPWRDYMLAKHYVSSNGVQFLNPGEGMTIGRAGHFTFKAVCSSATDGSQSVTFKVSSNVPASLDGNGPMPPGVAVPPIHVDSDKQDSTADNPLAAGDFAQVASASSSTEIAQDGQEADIFYTDGVNWGKPGTPGYHACFAGFTGFLTGGNSINNNPNPAPPPFSGIHS
jgi:hypothetical protein